MRSRNAECLHSQVEKWLGSVRAEDVHVVELGRTGTLRNRYVCVERRRESDSLALLFFFHDDGTWQVFPPKPKSAVMASQHFIVTSDACSLIGHE
jgi:hypothetical protein